MEKITMSNKQLKQAHVLRNFNEKVISRKAAAESLGLSERQISRLAKGVKEEGECALIHKNTGRKPAHSIPPERREQILSIRQATEFNNCNVTHFKELLEREHKIQISYGALYRLLKDAGIKSPKAHNKTKVHRKRKRKASAGELLQLDASPFDWFGIGKQYALQGAIDDATGQVTGLYMTENECLQGYLEVMRHTCLNFGVPLSAYSDKHTIFRSPLTTKKEEAGEEPNLTQFGRALSELGVNLIFAHSPQAKGRIERLWDTLQSRLPVEFRLRQITTIEQANIFLSEIYLSMYNERFAVEAEAKPIFIPYTHSEDLDNILCIKEYRKIDNAGSFSFHGRTFKVLDEGYPLIPTKAPIEVLVSIRQSVKVKYKKRIFKTEIVDKPVDHKTTAKQKKLIKIEEQVKPHLKHSSKEWNKIWHFESYSESILFLYELFFNHIKDSIKVTHDIA